MQSQGSTSSQPSFDSLSCSDSLLLSDSEQAEDDSEVFLTNTSSSVIIGGTSGAMPNGDSALGSPRSQWTSDNLTDKEEEEEGYRSESISKTSTDEPTSRTPKTQGDLLFSQKCAELQGFVRPLLELLNGLKKGRFDRGLSSFQQSVAMDRIQRIVGVLQRPTCGEKYLNTLLQVEVMLKVWFPHIQTFPVSAASSVATSPALSLHDTAGFTPPHRNRDQSHIPVKKRRLSWTGTDSSTPSPVLHKFPRLSSEEDKNIKHSSSAASDTSHTSTGSAAEGTEEKGQSSNCKGHSSEPSLTWVHVAPILSPRKSTSSLAPGNGDKQPVPMSLTTHRNSPATQDSSVSSTTTKRNQKNNTTKPARCQSQPSAAQLNDDPSRSKPPSQAVTLPRARPTPLET